MYERFSDRARRVMQLSNQEAQRFNHEYIGSEHILLGIVKEGGGLAAVVLKELGIELRKIRLEVENLIQSGPKMITMGKLPQTPRAKKVLEYSMEEARDLRQTQVDTEHLFLGLTRVREGVAYQVLTNFGFKIEKLRDEVRRRVELAGGGEHEIGKRPKKTKTPSVDALTEDMTELAREDKLPPVVGRQKEIDRLTTVLSRRDRNNVVLIGDSGTGRRSIAHGLAQQIVAKKARRTIADYRIGELDQALLVAGTKYRGQFEERVKAMVNEMRRAKNIILFVPQIHSLANLGLLEETGLPAFEIFKVAMRQNQIKCIGTCTQAEYDQTVAVDSDLQRLFQTIQVAPPTSAEALEILQGIKKVYEDFHRVEIRAEALQAAVELSEIYLPDAVMPEKAINLIDEASASFGADAIPPDVSGIIDQIVDLTKRKKKAVAGSEYDLAGKLRDEIKELRDNVNAMEEKWRLEIGTIGVVDVQDVIAALSIETGVSEQDIVDRKNVPGHA